MTRRHRVPYVLGALGLLAAVLVPILASPPAKAIVIEPKPIVLRPGETYVHEDQTTVPMVNNLGGLDPDGCLTGGNLYAPHSELACHVYNVVIDAPRDLIISGRLQLDIFVEYPKGTTLPNCSVPAVTRLSCSTNTMAAEAWKYPAEQILEPGRQIHVDFPAIGYLEYPDDPSTPVCGYIDGIPPHPPLPGQDRPTVTCGSDVGTVTDTPSNASSDSFGNEDPPITIPVVAAGKCAERPQETDPVILKYLKEAEGVCPDIAVNIASIMGITAYTVTMTLVNLDENRPVDKSFDPTFDEPGIPVNDGSVAPPPAEPAPVIGGTSGLVPGEAVPLPGSTLPGFGAPDGALSGLNSGTVIGNNDLAAAIVNRGAKPLTPPGDPSTALMLLFMVFLPLGGLATLLVVLFRRRHRDDALVSGAGIPLAA